MLDLLYHKRNPLIATVRGSSIFLKNNQDYYSLREKS